MPDKEINNKEIRMKILKILYDFYNENPYQFLEKKDLMERIEDIDETVLQRNIKYLGDKGFVNLNTYLGGNFLVQISADGIDYLESEEKV